MDIKTKFYFQVLLGSIIIGAVVFLVLRYLMRGPAFIKVLALGLIAITCYLVINDLVKRYKNQ